MEVVCNDPWVMDPATALGLAQQCRNMTGPACGSFVVFMDSTIMKRRVCYSSYTHGDMLESGVMLTKQPATWAAAVPCQGTYLALGKSTSTACRTAHLNARGCDVSPCTRCDAGTSWCARVQAPGPGHMSLQQQPHGMPY